MDCYARVRDEGDASLLLAQNQRGVVNVEVHLQQVLGLMQQLGDLRVEVDDVDVRVVRMAHEQRRTEAGARHLHSSVPGSVIQYLVTSSITR